MISRRELLKLALAGCFLDLGPRFRWTEGLHEVPIGSIRVNPAAYRAVSNKSQYYNDLVKSVKKNGVCVPLLVRRLDNGQLGLIDGLYRLEAAKCASLRTVPCHVRVMDMSVLESQIVRPLLRIPTDPKTYKRQLVKILRTEGMTKQQLAVKLGRPISWLEEKLSV